MSSMIPLTFHSVVCTQQDFLDLWKVVPDDSKIQISEIYKAGTQLITMHIAPNPLGTSVTPTVQFIK